MNCYYKSFEAQDNGQVDQFLKCGLSVNSIQYTRLHTNSILRLANLECESSTYLSSLTKKCGTEGQKALFQRFLKIRFVTPVKKKTSVLRILYDAQSQRILQYRTGWAEFSVEELRMLRDF